MEQQMNQQPNEEIRQDAAPQNEAEQKLAQLEHERALNGIADHRISGISAPGMADILNLLTNETDRMMELSPEFVQSMAARTGNAALLDLLKGGGGSGGIDLCSIPELTGEMGEPDEDKVNHIVTTPPVLMNLGEYCSLKRTRHLPEENVPEIKERG